MAQRRGDQTAPEHVARDVAEEAARPLRLAARVGLVAYGWSSWSWPA